MSQLYFAAITQRISPSLLRNDWTLRLRVRSFPHWAKGGQVVLQLGDHPTPNWTHGKPVGLPGYLLDLLEFPSSACLNMA
jgi:hypothetical protein